MSPVHVNPYQRRRSGPLLTRQKYVRRQPPPSDRNLLEPRIAELRESLEKRVGAYGEKKGVPLTEEQMRGLEKGSEITSEEHFVYQNTQAWAHASGIISTDEAQVIYRALGEQGTRANGGWARDTDLATKTLC